VDVSRERKNSCRYRWSELVVIAVVALIAIARKSCRACCAWGRQWMGKARKMGVRIPGPVQRSDGARPSMADLRRASTRSGSCDRLHHSGNVMTSLQKDVSDAMQIGDIDKRKEPSQEPSTRNRVRDRRPVEPTTPAAPTPETFVEPDHAAASEPLAITGEVQAPRDIKSTRDITAPQTSQPTVPRDAKAS